MGDNSPNVRLTIETTWDRNFRKWMQQVDIELLAKYGVCSSDLPDKCYAEWFDDKVSAKRAANRAIKGMRDE